MGKGAEWRTEEGENDVMMMMMMARGLRARQDKPVLVPVLVI